MEVSAHSGTRAERSVDGWIANSTASKTSEATLQKVESAFLKLRKDLLVHTSMCLASTVGETSETAAKATVSLQPT